MKMVLEFASERTSKPLKLEFILEKNVMAKKYSDLITKFNNQGLTIDPDNSYWNFHLDPKGIDRLSKALQSHMDSLQNEPTIDMPYKINSSVTQDELNAIHGAFEKYLNLVNSGQIVLRENQKSTYHLLQINLLVHKIENFRRLQKEIAQGHQQSLSCTFGFRYHKDEFHNLESADYDCFTTESNFGDFFCGYNTTGKNFIHCLADGDIEVVKAHGVKPQRTFSTEGYLYFGPTVKKETDISRLKAWWKENKIEAHGYHFDDKKNSFGLIRLARLIPPAEFEGKSHWERLQIIDQYDGVKACYLK